MGLTVDLTDSTRYRIQYGTYDLSTPGQVRFDLLVTGDTAAQRVANALAVQNVLNAARRAADMGQLALFGTARTGLATGNYVLTGGAMVPKTFYESTAQVYEVTLACWPALVGDAVTVSVAGSLSGTGAKIFIPDVGGDLDALLHLELTDNSPTGVISRVHLARLSDAGLNAASDFTAWVNAVALAGAGTTSDASALSGSYATRAVSALAPLDIARGVTPAGAYQRGRRDIWGRVSGSGTALAAPTGLSASKTDATQTTQGGTTTTTFVPSPGISVGNQHSATTTQTATTVSSTGLLYTGCQAGGTLLMVVRAAGVNAGTGALITPSGWQQVGISNDLSDRRYYLLAKVNNTLTSGAITVSHTQSPAAPLTLDMAYIELVGVPTSGSITGVSQPANYNLGAPAITTVRNGEAVVQLAAGDATLSFPFGGYANVVTGRAAIGMQVFDEKGSDAASAALPSTFGAQGVQWAVGVLPTGSDSTTTTGATTTFDEPTPGELAVGTYLARVQAIDAVNARSNATGSASVTTTIARSSVTFDWADTANAAAYAVTIQAFGRFYETITQDSTLTLTDLAGLPEVSGLPATSGAVAPAPFVRARLGTLNDYTHTAVDEVSLAGVTSFGLVKLASDRLLPPVGRQLNGDWLDWAVETQGRSANGASASVNVDGYWIVPSREPQAVIWAHGLALAAKSRWVIETHVSGRGVVAWLENISTGADAGRLLTSGAPLVAPGNNIILLAFEQAAGAHVMAASVTATLRYYPRFRWERGSL